MCASPLHASFCWYVPRVFFVRFSNMQASGHSSPLFGLRFTLRWLSRFLPWSRRWLERAGADFMLLCFRRQMNGAYHDIEWQLPSPLPSLRKIEANFKEEVEKFLQSKQSNRLLLHIDEHRSTSDSPDFRRGAMLLAGSLPAAHCQRDVA